MHPTQNPATTADNTTNRADGKPESDADRRLANLRACGYTGPIDADGYRVELGWCEICGTDGTLVRHRVDTDPREPQVMCVDTARCMSYFETASVPTPATELRQAGRYLDRYGWIQGAYYDPTARVFTPAACLVGAIGMVCYGGPVEAPAQMFDQPGFTEFEDTLAWLDAYLSVEYGQNSYEFNDTKGRTKHEVLVLLEEAANEYESMSTALLPCGCRADLFEDRGHQHDCPELDGEH